MNTIVTEIAENFIKKIVGLLTEREKGFAAIEESMLKEAKNCAAKLTGAYAEAVDAAIISDKAARQEMGYSVQRKSDERRILTLVGEVSYRRTYYKKASGGYEYLTDTALPRVAAWQSRIYILQPLWDKGYCLSNSPSDMIISPAYSVLNRR